EDGAGVARGVVASRQVTHHRRSVSGDEYRPLFGEREDDQDMERVRDAFEAAGRPFLRSPLPWIAWALLLPAAALLTPPVARRYGASGVLLLWSFTILAGGLVESRGFLSRRRAPTTLLAAWVLRIQGNLSLVAVLLSALLVWVGAAAYLPGLWLLLIGHSFYVVGGLALPAMRRAGVVMQLGGALALWPGGPALAVFAVTVFVAALGMAWAVRGQP
ncbi:MAG TPA: hypothetical protein VKA53_02635, partial [Thermoanaerobaculia bacterium]|nr:hypothetical protein [Thermoanaerobaculia bacterium]